jgi:DNA/RNA endonuclease G (NUC1)
MNSIGVFSGLKIEQKFKRASFWDRKCPIHVIDHGTGAGFEEASDAAEVYAAAYNECNGVSDVVYYKVEADKFEKGGGRGSGGWSNDDELVDIMASLGKKSNEYATVVDYQGCGLFGLDRGHQAPVASFNADDESARMTNTPTNLSPQAGYLNQNVWKYLEMEMRSKSEEADELDDEASNSFELITGPLYALPEAFFENDNGAELWEDC